MGVSPAPRRRRIPVPPGPDPGVPRAVELHVEGLVLHGLAAGDRFAIAEALQRELARLIAEHGVPGLAGGSAIERIDGGAFRVAPGSNPRGLGAQVAVALYRGLTQEAVGPAPSAGIGSTDIRSAPRAHHR